MINKSDYLISLFKLLFVNFSFNIVMYAIAHIIFKFVTKENILLNQIMLKTKYRRVIWLNESSAKKCWIILKTKII
jgi:hypothetical protein